MQLLTNLLIGCQHLKISMCAQAEAVAAGVADIPAQLMFVHQGQRDVKEVTLILRCGS